jgi:hypothetical protein
MHVVLVGLVGHVLLPTVLNGCFPSCSLLLEMLTQCLSRSSLSHPLIGSPATTQIRSSSPRDSRGDTAQHSTAEHNTTQHRRTAGLRCHPINPAAHPRRCLSSPVRSRPLHYSTVITCTPAPRSRRGHEGIMRGNPHRRGRRGGGGGIT